MNDVVARLTAALDRSYRIDRELGAGGMATVYLAHDLKPENILLHDGSAVVADFGIALAVQQAGGQRMTQTELSLGTPHHAAGDLARRSDHCVLRSRRRSTGDSRTMD